MTDNVIRYKRGQIRLVSDDPSLNLSERTLELIAIDLQHVDPSDTFNVQTHVNNRLPDSHVVERVDPESLDQVEASTVYIRRRDAA